ncbi:MAG TPA: ligase-associated DNA damage response endonuclease PdeM [Gemmatimonadaceae bacterium]|nr:ligase-associated DNA damage response endonuclease PdeM [Gemmatimonadaceae bacterium]
MKADERDVSIDLAAQSVWLLPERAVYWEERRTLLIADPHWGKAATFRAEGIPVPSGTTGDGLTRLRAMTERYPTRRIVFLGDFLHARAGRSEQMLAALARWRADCPDVELLLVRGNHDRHAGDPPGEMKIKCVDAPFADSPFVLCHHPVAHPDGHVLAGHTHPAARLTGAGRETMRLPCFLIGRRTTVLPAFGDFTGLGDIEPEMHDRVFVVAGDRVIAV